MTDLPIRTLTADDLLPAWACLETAFGGATAPEDERAAELGMVEPHRFSAAFDGERPVATAGSFDLLMTVPGGPLPVAGVTWVGVLPTYRRRGLMSRLMQRQLSDLRDEGKAVAALWASESSLYARYGYGTASWSLVLELPKGTPFAQPVDVGGLRLVEPTDAALQEIHERVAGTTPGWFRRDAAWWTYRLHDGAASRDGAGPLQAVVADGGTGPEGYALYSVKGGWDAGLPNGRVVVREVAAATPTAAARLWRHLLDLDLAATVTFRLAAVDDPILLLLADGRRAKPALRDSLWVRLVDVPAALAARRYAADVDVVLEVDDPLCPWNAGRWRLTAGPRTATCVPTTDPADLVLHVSDLGAAYLGGTPLQARAAAGGVQEHAPGALTAASTAFGPVGRAPYCPIVF